MISFDHATVAGPQRAAQQRQCNNKPSGASNTMSTIQKLSEAKAKAILSPHQTIPVASCGRPVASCVRNSEHEYPMCCRFHNMFADALHQIYVFPDMRTDHFHVSIKIALIVVSTRPHQLVRKINCMVLITIRFEAVSTDGCTMVDQTLIIPITS